MWRHLHPHTHASSPSTSTTTSLSNTQSREYPDLDRSGSPAPSISSITSTTNDTPSNVPLSGAAASKLRRGSVAFDLAIESSPGGILKETLVSAAHAKEFYESLQERHQQTLAAAAMRGQDGSHGGHGNGSVILRELNLTLGWSTTYNDLKLLRDTLLHDCPHLLKLRLDCGNHSGPKSDLVNRGKRGNPLVQIMLQHPSLLLVDFVAAEGFFSRSNLSQGFVLRASTTGLQEVRIDATFDPRSHGEKVKVLLESCPELTALTLTCKDLDFATTVSCIRELVSNGGYDQFRYLDLSSPQFSAAFDRMDGGSVFGKTYTPALEEKNNKAALLMMDNNLVVIDQFGMDLETILIDDNFGDEHVARLEKVTRQSYHHRDSGTSLSRQNSGSSGIYGGNNEPNSNNIIGGTNGISAGTMTALPGTSAIPSPAPYSGCKLKVIEMRIGYALIANSALTSIGQAHLTAILRRQPQTQLMFSISHDRLEWFEFLGGVFDKVRAIQVDFHSMNKWVPILEAHIAALFGQLLDQHQVDSRQHLEREQGVRDGHEKELEAMRQRHEQDLLAYRMQRQLQLQEGTSSSWLPPSPLDPPQQPQQPQPRRPPVPILLDPEQHQLNDDPLSPTTTSTSSPQSNDPALQTLLTTQTHERQNLETQHTHQLVTFSPPPARPNCPIYSLEIRGTNNIVQSTTAASLSRILLLSPGLQILGLASFELENGTQDWERILNAVNLFQLEELALEETDIDGRSLALLMNRMPMAGSLEVEGTASGGGSGGGRLRVLDLVKSEKLTQEDLQGLRIALQERVPGCRLVV